MRGARSCAAAGAARCGLALALGLGLAARSGAHEQGGAPDAPAAASAPAARYEPPSPGSYELPPLGRIPARTLLGADGRPAPLLALRPGEAALVSFVYLHCADACPAATAVLADLDRRIAAEPKLAGRVELVTVSVDPARDPPAAMALQQRALAPRGRWRFLTSASVAKLDPVLADFGQDVRRVASASGAPEVATHTLKVFLVDARGRIREIYGSAYLDARVLLNDLLTVLAE